MACPTGDLCGADRACHLDPASTWQVRVSRAETTMTWDSNSPADIQIELWCPANATTAVTQPVVQDTDQPTWSSGGCSLRADALLTTGIAFAAQDVDALGEEVITARTTYHPVEANLRAGTASPGAAGGLSSVTFTFTPQ